MSNNPDLLNNRVVDNQTGRQVQATALTNFALAGWVNFQDSVYDGTNKLRLVENTPTKVTFTPPLYSQTLNVNLRLVILNTLYGILLIVNLFLTKRIYLAITVHVYNLLRKL